MADVKPLSVAGGQIQQFQPGDRVPIAHHNATIEDLLNYIVYDSDGLIITDADGEPIWSL